MMDEQRPDWARAQLREAYRFHLKYHDPPSASVTARMLRAYTMIGGDADDFKEIQEDYYEQEGDQDS